MMIIRLIIPECKEWCGWYCRDAENLKDRLEILKFAFSEKCVDLVVTSNNFLCFYPNQLIDAENFVKTNIIPYLNQIASKKPTILDFDLLTAINPYNGINAIVCFLDVDNNNNFIYKTHIWECWLKQKVCDYNSFLRQNCKRMVDFNGYKIGLLSCGDIVSYCHNNGKILPEVDLYIDLSHESLKGHCSQSKIPSKIIDTWNRSKYVFVTQQVGKETIDGYRRKNRYPYIFPKDTSHCVTVRSIGNKKVAFVDVNIGNKL